METPEKENAQGDAKKRKTNSNSIYHQIFYHDQHEREPNEQAWDDLAEMVQAGFTDTQIATVYKIDFNTIQKWKQKHSKFVQALEENKRRFDDGMVIRSAYERAVGFVVKEQKAMVVAGKVQIIDVDKHIIPSESAQQFWLTNRLPDEWKNRNHNHNTNTNRETAPVNGIDYSKYSDEELAVLEALLQKGAKTEE
jgi:hypothetical protein